MAENNTTIDPTLTMLTPEPAGPRSSENGSTTNADGDKKEPKEPKWSYHKPTTRQGQLREMYGPQLKIRKRSTRLKPESISMHFTVNG